MRGRLAQNVENSTAHLWKQEGGGNERGNADPIGSAGSHVGRESSTEHIPEGT